MAMDLTQVVGNKTKKPKQISRIDFRRFTDAAERLGKTTAELAVELGYTRQASYDWNKIRTAPAIAVEAAELCVLNEKQVLRIKGLEASVIDVRGYLVDEQIKSSNLATDVERLNALVKTLQIENARLAAFEKAPPPKPSTVVIAVPRNEADKELLLAVCKGRINVMLLNPLEVK